MKNDSVVACNSDLPNEQTTVPINSNSYPDPEILASELVETGTGDKVQVTTLKPVLRWSPTNERLLEELSVKLVEYLAEVEEGSWEQVDELVIEQTYEIVPSCIVVSAIPKSEE